MKNLLNLNGAVQLSKVALKAINGGKRQCDQYGHCPSGSCCSGGVCLSLNTEGLICDAETPPNEWGE